MLASSTIPALSSPPSLATRLKSGPSYVRSLGGPGRRLVSVCSIDAAPILFPETSSAWEVCEGGVVAPLGFKASGVSAGLRSYGTSRPDLTLVVSDCPAAAAGRTPVAAAPVLYCKKALQESMYARAVLTNAGQANAATGSDGMADAHKCSEEVSRLLEITTNEVLLLSTGVIGKRIKMEELLQTLPTSVNCLGREVADGNAAAEAITTTDLVAKRAALKLTLPGSGAAVTIGGMAKGSGMIHPDMATMLGIVTCDAAVDPSVWQSMLRKAASNSFNQITVDGDTSTNDTVLGLANGMSGAPIIESEDTTDAVALYQALEGLCQGLAKSIAWDGEGATVLLEVNTKGAKDQASARAVSKAIASSSLVKSAVFGTDPNWVGTLCADCVPRLHEGVVVIRGQHSNGCGVRVLREE
eukprot:scaffold8173_cov672-Prasinococcus_capsulatus_cf.AAC.1